MTLEGEEVAHLLEGCMGVWGRGLLEEDESKGLFGREA